MSARSRIVFAVLCCLTGLWGNRAWSADANAGLSASPPAVQLDRPEARQQLLIWERAADGSAIDMTRSVTFEILDPAVAQIDPFGMISPKNEGETKLVARHGTATCTVPITVRGVRVPPPISFEHEIIPVFSKAGCNAGTCHGKAEGKNGFKLSVFGFDPAADYEALVKQGRQRRISPAAPENSLILRKATARIPHGGGRRLLPESVGYQRLCRWLSAGAPRAGEAAPVARIEIEPTERILAAGLSQQLRVTAADDLGNRHCVTSLAEYVSNAPAIARVNDRGLVESTDIAGEAAVLVRYMGHVGICRVTLPKPGVRFTRPPEENFIDRLVWKKLERLGIAPSELVDDPGFLRRVFLDTTGVLPTPDEARAFLSDARPDKRTRLIESLLERDEYADYWAMFWADILRVDRDRISAEGCVAVQRWLKDQFARNTPYDQFAREIVTAQGDTFAPGPASFYKVLDTPELMGKSISQLLLGVRIECAQCHHHPTEKWTQDDYYALAGFFTGVTRKSLPNGNQAIVGLRGGDVPHPKTGRPVATHAPGAPAAVFDHTVDRRTVLADWLTAPDNPFLAKAVVNRLCAHYLGRGIVEPVDDLRETNPPTNAELFDALADHLRSVHYDLKAFTKTLLSARVYQLSSRSNSSNVDDVMNYSHAFEKALPAEVLLDAISHATGVPEKFNGWPAGYRAVQVWDNAMPSYFFQIFGRPVRATVCQCERSNEPSIAQALHLMNSPEILEKIHADLGRAGQLAASKKGDAEIIEELFLATLCRFPTAAERTLFLAQFQQSDRRHAAEDVLWTLLNSKEFLYNQ